MEDTWFSRDLPVLDVVVRMLDGGYQLVEAHEIAEHTGLDVKEVDRALDALEGPFIVK